MPITAYDNEKKGETMSDITPGPWTVTPYLTPERDDDPMGVYKVQPAFDDLTKLYFEMDPEDNDFYEKVHDVNEANARLIAAAPSLLAFVEQVARLRASGEIGCPDCGGPLEDHPDQSQKQCVNCGEEMSLADYDEAAADEAFDHQEALSRLIHDARKLLGGDYDK
jgi:hypothetical protein